MNFVKSIPSGKDDGVVNKRVGEVIKLMYKARNEAKLSGNEKLSKTIKQMMNSCWGYSIKRPKVLCNKYVDNNKIKFMNDYNSFIAKVAGNNITLIKSFVTHYTFPQFAKSVLDEYNAFVEHIKSQINVFYQNIDAFLTNEDGYKRLCDLGLVGDDIGQFKIEHVFKEIAIISSRRYVATTIDDEVIWHCVDKNKLTYESVVNQAKLNIQ